MNTKTIELQEWESCDSGFLVGYSERAKSTRRRRVVMRAGVSVAAVFIAVSLGLWSTGIWPGPAENYFGGIACHEVAEKMPAMMAGTVSAETRARIEAHLRECPRCREMMQKMGAGNAAVSISELYLACDCDECREHLARAANAIAENDRIGGKFLLALISAQLVAHQR